jgi:hypothetical protein
MFQVYSYYFFWCETNETYITVLFLVQDSSLGDDIWPKLKAYVISGPQQVD